MLRSVTLSVVFSVLAAACALVEQPVPAGPRPIAARVHNGGSLPAEITVTVPAGVLTDAVQPSVVERGTTRDVTIYLPTSGEWSIAFNTDATFDSTRPGVARLIREGCPMFEFEIVRDSIGLDCVQKRGSSDMLRSVTLGLALSVLAAACALVEPPQPVPAGTFRLQGEVRNMKSEPVSLAVMTSAGVLPGAVQPASVPAHTAANVTFDVPLAKGGSILVDSRQWITNTEVDGEGCTLGIEVAADEGITYGCDLFTVP